MELFWKACAGVLIAVILQLTLSKQGNDMGTLLAVAVCCMVCIIGFSYLEPVLDLLKELEALGDLQDGVLGILLKALGIGLVAEVAGMVCCDAGNTSMGKTIQLLGSAVILSLSVPIFRSLLELIQRILGEL